MIIHGYQGPRFCNWTSITVGGKVSLVACSLPAPSSPSPTTGRGAGVRTTCGVRTRLLAAGRSPHARLGAGVVLTGLVLAGVGDATHSSLVLGPFAATASLKHTAPRSEVVRPRTIVGGYLVASLIGVAAGLVFGPTALATVGAAALAAVVLLALGLEHPPAVAMTVVAVQAATPHVIAIALVGTITMVLTMAVLAPALHRERWPLPRRSTVDG